jgi:hypothetical protein
MEFVQGEHDFFPLMPFFRLLRNPAIILTLLLHLCEKFMSAHHNCHWMHDQNRAHTVQVHHGGWSS